jgi:hypothetical protein
MGEEDNSEAIRKMAWMSPMNMYGSAIIQLTNPETEIYKMELAFRGMKLDSDGNPIEIEGAEPMMNDYGIARIVGMVQALVNQVTIMSNISKKETIDLMQFFNRELVRNLMVNRIAYNIKTFDARDAIHFTALSTAFVTLKRASEESISDKKFWGRSFQEIHSKVESQPQKSGGILSKLNPWSK